MYSIKSLRRRCYIGFILIYILQGCGITYSGMSGSSGGMSGSSGSVRGMSGRGMSGGADGVNGVSSETNAEKQARLDG